MANVFLWILDNGHGKATPGKRSPVLADGRQLLEYEFNRDIVSRLIVKLTSAGYAYHNLVPEIEGDISLTQRVNRANNLVSTQTKLFISIHENAAGTGGWVKASGTETFCYEFDGESERLAKYFQQKLVASLGWKDRGVKTADFTVIQKTSMPAILIEHGFYTDPDEVLKLLDPAWREKIAESHFQTIKEIEQAGLSFFK